MSVLSTFDGCRIDGTMARCYAFATDVRSSERAHGCRDSVGRSRINSAAHSQNHAAAQHHLITATAEFSKFQRTTAAIREPGFTMHFRESAATCFTSPISGSRT
jgi:hypothetical protein